ncbi:MAG: polysaccharide pyruvyl transferase family protein [Ruminococcus sp.]|nr:polysaccharide pyruvyl transferase family protein [Ruminococcus sp.]
MSKYIVILNTVKNNRGSEALARGISEIICHNESNAEVWIVSNDADIEELPPLPNTKGFIRKSTVTKKNLIMGAIYTFFKKVLKLRTAAASIRYSKLIDICKKSDVVICVGGDNYDIHYNMFENLHELHSVIRIKANARMIMYDCSFGENDITDEVISDISQFDAITVRERTSKQNLTTKYSKKDIRYYPDPAFAMPLEVVDFPQGWKKGKMVGVNLSSLILDPQYGGSAEVTFAAYQNMVKKIIEKGYTPIFVPHVMGGSDYKPLEKLYQACESYGDMLLLGEDYNAAQLKYIISQCQMFIGARTHSTIAAYSSCVPTLVIGYSVKSVGIARDLFGTDENYVLKVDKVDDKEQIANAFLWLNENQNDIRTHLNAVMPEYIKEAYNSYSIIKR